MHEPIESDDDIKQNIKKLKQKLKQAKQALKDKNAEGRYGTVSEPRKSLSTYLRNQNKLEVSMVTILDRKASILIRISTSLVSAIIIFHGYIEENVSNGHTISHILLFGLLITLVLSILATKPFLSILRRVMKKEIQPIHPGLEENNFLMMKKCDLKEYEESMEKVVQSQDLQLGNQIRANYILARNNRYKAAMLDVAYNVFLITFILVGVIFSLSRFHH